MRAILPVLLALLLGASCGGTDLPSRPSAHKALRFADITSADGLQYVRPGDRITRPDLVGQPPRFIFETDGTLCPQACDTEAWDGTTLSCVSIRHVPAERVTPYVIDPARAGVNGDTHGAYRADSISFRGQPLRAGACEEPGIPMTCAMLSITTGGSSP